MKKFFEEVFSIVISVVIALVIFWVVRTYLFYPFKVDGDSMKDTMLDGERFILNLRDPIDQSDIVVFPAPDGSGDEYVKRIIGVPGDTVEYKDDILYINGEAIDEPYLDTIKADYFARFPEDTTFTDDFTLEDITGQTTVPEGSYFVLGDNREVSHDSRYFGFIDADSVEGTTHFRYWPLDKIGSVQ
jgi:signal peptidase I